MCTSPISEQTVLLWGHHWWLPGRHEPLAFASLADAAHTLAMHFGTDGSPERIRLIYQPETLVSAEVACPRGNRATLQKALAFEHPALAQPDHAWSHEPIYGDGPNFSTFLHYEQEPFLFTLVAQLSDHGIHVASAWPLATYLHALPAEWSDSGAILVIATEASAAVAYHHPAGEKRTLRHWHGPTAAADASAWLQSVVAERPRDPALVLASAPIETLLDSVRYLALTDALDVPVIMPAAHPAQLLPAAPFLTPNRAAIAASILLLLAGGWSGASYAREFMAWSKQQSAVVSEKTALRSEIEHYRINSHEIVALRAKLAGPGASPPVSELLESVCAKMPNQLALDRVRVEQGRFTLSGHVAPDAVAAWDQWKSRLVSKRWALGAIVAPRASGAFTVNGVFSP